MNVETSRTALSMLAAFVNASPPPLARTRAAAAILDTIGVTLAGASEPAARAVQQVVAEERGGRCVVLGTDLEASAPAAALANGTAAHALDYDDMCFVSLAHPSAPLVGALLAAGERTGASGADVVAAYVIGFEIEARLGRVMNPRHYQRGWHCTSTLGAIGAAAAVSRLLGLDAHVAAHAIAIAASEASGLKENFGTMVKPLHAGLAARDGVLAALLASRGLTASEHALEGPQGYLRAMDSERSDLDRETADLGVRWEIVDTGITVKLYPSCAGTHPALDTILDLREQTPFAADEVERIEIDVDSITPTILIYDRPTTGLEGKFSMPFCAAAAAVSGRVSPDTFDSSTLADPRIIDMIERVTMKVDSSLDGVGPALTQARVTITLRDGRVVSRRADGARGYPSKPASETELAGKFLACARQALTDEASQRALELLRGVGELPDIRVLTSALSTSTARESGVAR